MDGAGGAERFGPFVFLKRLGSGGMGTAHLATHPGTEGLLVVKRMHPGMVRDPVLFKRFVHEAEVVSHVQHPNVAALVAMGTIDSEPFLATEYVFGLQASQLIDRAQNTAIDPLPLHVALQISIELTAGLAAIHGARHRDTGTPLGLLHRDVGARNVLVGFDGRVRLIDLGLGKSILADWHTATDVLAGSPDYMPPEQAMGAVVDARADVYAAAVTVWELLAGTKRIQEGTVAARVRRAIEAQPESLTARRTDVPASLDRLLQRAMAADPDQRIGSAAELSQGLSAQLRRLRRGRSEESVRSWLDAACATIIARERRALQQLRSKVPDLASTDSHIELMVGDVQGWVPSRPPDALPSRSTKRPAVELRRLMPGAVVFIVVLFLAAGATMIGLRPPATPIRAKIPALPPSAPELVSPAHPPPVTTSSPTVYQDPPVVEPRSVPVLRPPVSAAVRDQKRVLLQRIRRLRKIKYEISWQRRLTSLSTQLSRARSLRALRQIEASLTRLEQSE
ncbi:MAG: protein kinase [Myxococcota bacterium]